MVCNLCCNRLACDIALTSPELLLKTFVNTVGRHGHKWRIILIEFISKTYSANLIPVVPTANIRFILFNLHWSARDALSFFILKNKYKSIRVSIPINIKKKHLKIIFCINLKRIRHLWTLPVLSKHCSIAASAEVTLLFWLVISLRWVVVLSNFWA